MGEIALCTEKRCVCTHNGGTNPGGKDKCLIHEECGGCQDNYKAVCTVEGCFCKSNKSDDIAKKSKYCNTLSDCGGCPKGRISKCVYGECRCKIKDDNILCPNGEVICTQTIEGNRVCKCIVDTNRYCKTIRDCNKCTVGSPICTKDGCFCIHNDGTNNPDGICKTNSNCSDCLPGYIPICTTGGCYCKSINNNDPAIRPGKKCNNKTTCPKCNTGEHKACLKGVCGCVPNEGNNSGDMCDGDQYCGGCQKGKYPSCQNDLCVCTNVKKCHSDNDCNDFICKNNKEQTFCKTDKTCGCFVDNIRPTCKILVSSGIKGNNGWYRGSVTLKIEAKDNFKIKDYYFDITKSKTFTYNGDNRGLNIIGRAIDTSGNVGTCSFFLKLDKTNPTCTVHKNSGESLYGVSGYVSKYDSVSGIEGYTKENFSGLKLSKTFNVYDKAGNSSSCLVDVHSHEKWTQNINYEGWTDCDCETAEHHGFTESLYCTERCYAQNHTKILDTDYEYCWSQMPRSCYQNSTICGHYRSYRCTISVPYNGYLTYYY